MTSVNYNQMTYTLKKGHQQTSRITCLPYMYNIFSAGRFEHQNWVTAGTNNENVAKKSNLIWHTDFFFLINFMQQHITSILALNIEQVLCKIYLVKYLLYLTFQGAQDNN